MEILTEISVLAPRRDSTTGSYLDIDVITYRFFVWLLTNVNVYIYTKLMVNRKKKRKAKVIPVLD
jgi:hypothetical protein